MCRRVQCSECNKPTYAGCGMHVEQVLADVPREDRCSCGEKPKKRRQQAVVEPSLLRRIFGL